MKLLLHEEKKMIKIPFGQLSESRQLQTVKVLNAGLDIATNTVAFAT